MNLDVFIERVKNLSILELSQLADIAIKIKEELEKEEPCTDLAVLNGVEDSSHEAWDGWRYQYSGTGYIVFPSGKVIKATGENDEIKYEQVDSELAHFIRIFKRSELYRLPGFTTQYQFEISSLCKQELELEKKDCWGVTRRYNLFRLLKSSRQILVEIDEDGNDVEWEMFDGDLDEYKVL